MSWQYVKNTTNKCIDTNNVHDMPKSDRSTNFTELYTQTMIDYQRNNPHASLKRMEWLMPDNVKHMHQVKNIVSSCSIWGAITCDGLAALWFTFVKMNQFEQVKIIQ